MMRINAAVSDGGAALIVVGTYKVTKVINNKIRNPKNIPPTYRLSEYVMKTLILKVEKKVI